MKPLAEQFMDWVRVELINAGLKDGEVFDQREKDLSWLVGKEITSVTGLAAMVSLPKERRTGSDDAPDATEYRLSVLVGIRTNHLLGKTRGTPFKIAHDAFLHFVGRAFYLAEADAPKNVRLTGNVVADAFSPDADKKMEFYATFELSTTYIIDHDNGIF